MLQLATIEDFGHLLIDLDPKISECLRCLSNIVPPSPTIFIQHPQKRSSHLLKLEEKELCTLKQLLNSHHCRSILARTDSFFNRYVCDCFVNFFRGHVPANKNFIESKKVPFEKIVDPMFSIREKRKDWQTIFYWLNQSENRVTFI